MWATIFPLGGGGVETYVYNVCKHLQRRGHQVHVICASLPLAFNLLTE
ncbi:glycosyltransferase [[Eubacterium] cellulosolvens]